ncbi:MAG: cytochrome c [Deltaproteobacteria bacterium]|nr:cytochrome c [Deltaproteobacteria bacterium]
MHRLAAGFSVFATMVCVGSTMVAGVLLNPNVAWAKSGEEIFQSGCNACHTIGGGRLVGPDLLGVSERRTEEWLVKFVQHSQSMVEAGDPVAVGLFEEHNKVTMPDQALTKAEVLAVMEYAKTPHVIGAVPPDEPVALTEEDIVLGQNLFEGPRGARHSRKPAISGHARSLRGRAAHRARGQGPRWLPRAGGQREGAAPATGLRHRAFHERRSGLRHPAWLLFAPLA